ncbi:hypothetical protein CLV94_2405 [Flavobacterium endophyticum]|uniref:HNH endonuclease n=1 Tax=Flavobacterium endophyticum TaxID=1540163 RepID=A0A495M947_9FLAO|nr:hypothetical protein [Flavobacterium endophyticum]RKS21770.1 hypothetical protein CLV94_2405 [Flavobacterium endophyticum]
MLRVTKPTLSSVRVYSDCIRIVRNRDLRNRLTACEDLIQQAEQEFENKITKGLMHTINREETVNRNVTAKELKDVYTLRMVGNPAGRIHYDELFLSAPQELCPLCAHRNVTTLDHYLPKAEYPRLSVVPINLIPSCKDCNTGKLSFYPTSPETETLHPYYDNIENIQWLKATVNRTSPICINFYAERQSDWTDLLFERVKHHIETYGLKSLYSVQAARELSAIKRMLINDYTNGGSEEVRKRLMENAGSRLENNRNLWTTALYLGLANDAWFCEEGFRQIG